MLSHATLIFDHLTDQRSLAIPVINFVVLPVGSEIAIHLNGRAFLETGRITDYCAHSEHGILIGIEDGGATGFSDRTWEEIAELCVPDKENFCSLIYPVVVDFGRRYLAAPTHR